jgi:pSer/pThr/pTyr-binding forkhead associated (FHA) protein
MLRVWVVGSGQGCDLVADGAGVSSRHCRLQRDETGYVVEDLASTNGTFVNGTRITGPARVSPADVVTLGRSAPMPWPTDSGGPATTLRLGRDAENEIVIDLPMVSGRHAMVGRDGAGGSVWIEDLGSSNGTSVGAPGRISGRQKVEAKDDVFLGSLAVSGAWLLHRVGASPDREMPLQGDVIVLGRDPECDRVIEDSRVSGRHASLSRRGDRFVIEDLGSAGGTSVNGRWIAAPSPVREDDVIGLGTYTFRLSTRVNAATIAQPSVAFTINQAAKPEANEVRLPPEYLELAGRLGGLVAQAVVIALVIVAAVANGDDRAKAAARSLEATALASVWFGVSTWILLANPRERARPQTKVPTREMRAVAVVAVIVVQCALTWAVVAPGCGLKTSIVPAVALMVLASAVGAAIGSLIRTIAPRPGIAMAVALAAVAVMGLVQGLATNRSGIAGPVADATPSRWAFEGLLLMESDRREAVAGGAGDLAEPYFSAASDRSGVRACAMALGFMLAGLAASAAFIARGWSEGPISTSGTRPLSTAAS